MSKKIKVGDIVKVTNIDHWAYGEWGRVVHEEDGIFYVRIADDDTMELVFDIDEIKNIRRN